GTAPSTCGRWPPCLAPCARRKCGNSCARREPSTPSAPCSSRTTCRPPRPDQPQPSLRHGRACPGHPCPVVPVMARRWPPHVLRTESMDGRDKPGHDGGGGMIGSPIWPSVNRHGLQFVRHGGGEGGFAIN